MMMWQKQLKLIFGVGCLWCVPFSLAVKAQIIPDSSLGNENSVVTPNVTVKEKIADLIEGGAIRGNNLFHSFEQFNISDGTAVYFANPDGIANILTRVTGNNISEIFGTLGVDGAANLFLLNPNGIVFGENAALDVNGSFLATTAESYIFENGFEYSASTAEIPPLLTVNIPLGMQFGLKPGNIQVNGVGQQILTNTDPLYISPWKRLSTPANLEVTIGNTLALIGGEINLTGSSLRAEQGRIELGGVKSGTVNLQQSTSGWIFDYSQVSTYHNVNLKSLAAIDAGGLSSKGIQIVGKQIEIADGSVVLSQSLSNTTKTTMDILATESLKVSGTDSTSLIPSTLSLVSLVDGDGELNITANELIIENGAGVGSVQFGTSNTGIDLNIKIDQLILVDGFSPSNPSRFSRLGNLNLGDGNGGNVNLFTKKLKLNNGGFLGATVAFSNGNGGDVNIKATDLVEVTGLIDNVGLVNNVSSAIDASNAGNGDAGSINITTAQLNIKDGGDIFATSVAGSDAGSIKIHASKEINLSNPTDYYSSIASSVFANTDIQKLLGLPLVPDGNAGTIKIQAPQIVIVGNAGISVANEGTGQAGNIQIQGNSLVLNQGSAISAMTASGAGGDIALQLEDLLLLDNQSQISSRARGTGNGGNININSTLITLLKENQINANAFEGDGGSIKIVTEGLFSSANSQITASSEFGLNGEITLNILNSDRKIQLDKLPENPLNATQQVIYSCQEGQDNFTISGKGGLPENPTQSLRNNTVWQDVRIIATDLSESDSVAQNQQQTTPIQEAQAWRLDQQGNLELFAMTASSEFQHHQPDCPSLQ